MIMQMDDPRQFVVFSLAALISLFAILFKFYRSYRHGGSVKSLVLPLFIGMVLTLFAGLSAFHNKTNESLPWLFSSEAIDRGVFEWATAICLLAVCVLAYKIMRKITGLQRYLFAGLGLASFVICGEELSWGQWIFGWETPEDLAEINLQDETNLHNLVNPRTYDLVYYAMGYTVLLGALLAYFVFGSSNQGRAAYFKGVKGIFLSAGHWLRQSQTGLVITLAAATLIQHELLEEYAEFVLALDIALFVYHHNKALPKSDLSGKPKFQLRKDRPQTVNRLAS